MGSISADVLLPVAWGEFGFRKHNQPSYSGATCKDSHRRVSRMLCAWRFQKDEQWRRRRPGPFSQAWLPDREREQVTSSCQERLRSPLGPLGATHTAGISAVPLRGLALGLGQDGPRLGWPRASTVLWAELSIQRGTILQTLLVHHLLGIFFHSGCPP